MTILSQQISPGCHFFKFFSSALTWLNQVKPKASLAYSFAIKNNIYFLFFNSLFPSLNPIPPLSASLHRPPLYHGPPPCYHLIFCQFTFIDIHVFSFSPSLTTFQPSLVFLLLTVFLPFYYRLIWVYGKSDLIHPQYPFAFLKNFSISSR